MKFFFQILFGYRGSTANLGVCLRKFGGSWPAGLGGDRERTNSSKRRVFIKKKFKKNSKKILEMFS
jgi:hypothetical protein